MLKEKLTKFLKGDGNNKKKTENLIFLLIILIVTIVGINMIWNDDEEKEEVVDPNKKLAVTKDVDKGMSLEEKLENILSKISGVGNVDVLITYNETEEIVPVYNIENKTSITNEVDSGGGTRVIQETDSSQEVIYQNDEIIVKKTVSPKIEGAIIAATGASNSGIKNNIIQAVEAATGLATHKIQVFEKQN